nr:hypothetical protein Iba_chr08bCG8870 [Ipomoea batatas]
MVIPTLGVPLSAPSLGHDIWLPAKWNSICKPLLTPMGQPVLKPGSLFQDFLFYLENLSFPGKQRSSLQFLVIPLMLNIGLCSHKNLEAVAPAFPTALNVHSPCISEGTNCLLGLQVWFGALRVRKAEGKRSRVADARRWRCVETGETERADARRWR